MVTEVIFFKDFALTIEHGEAWTVIGPSGCGKTTLLFLVAGLKAPVDGTIRVGGEVIKRPRPSTGLVFAGSWTFALGPQFMKIRGLVIKYVIFMVLMANILPLMLNLIMGKKRVE